MIGYVLIMIIGGYSSQSGFAVVQQEFSTRDKCENVRGHIAKIHEQQGSTQVRSQGCYPL